ncbi:hypothetical protein PT2222_420003 [Paraburkholderia tropica]
MSYVRRGAQQMDRFHQAIVMFLGHDNRIGGVAAGNQRYVHIINNLVDDSLQIGARVGEWDGTHMSSFMANLYRYRYNSTTLG